MLRSLTTLCLMLLLGLSLQVAAQSNRSQRVRFDPGTTGTHLSDGVARGETMTYVLGAGAGQKMRVSLDSVEQNAVFQVLAPNGRVLGESVEREGFQVWFGRLPSGGDYRIVVGTTRGGAEYTITFNIF